MSDSPATDRRGIHVTTARIVCSIHGEPFRAQWPKGWPTFAALLLEIALADPALIEETGGEVANVEAALDATPACERVDRSTLLEAYHESQVGKSGLCKVCGRLRRGTPYQAHAGGRKHHLAHVCFLCVVNNLRPAS